jgi:hypothetical protein
MEVRRAIDNETTNIGFVGKDLDTTALETFATESSPVLDDYTGAAAAYSLRKVRSAYTGSAVRVRRSSDDELQDIGFDANGDLDTTALTTFVNEDVNTYSSDFSSGIDGLIESRVTASSVDGISDGTTSKDDVLQSVLTSGSNTHYIYKNGTFDLSNTYDVSFEYYIPSVRPDGVTPQTIDGIVVRTGTGSDGAYPFSVLDSWESETIQNWSPSTSNLLLFAAAVGEFIGSIDADGDVYYLKNIVVTQTTADGAVTTWYDQSGNGNDATNSTESEQPLIVDGGTLVEENGKAAIDFDYNSSNNLSASPTDWSFVTSSNTSIFMVMNLNQYNTPRSVLYNISGDEVSSGQGDSLVSMARSNQLRIGYYDKSAGSWTPTPDGFGVGIDGFAAQQNLISSIYNSSGALDSYANNTISGSITSNPEGSITANKFFIGSNSSGTNPMDGNLQEFIIFNSDETSNRTGIEGNIGRYYNIDGFRDVFVTKWYDQSGNFNHAENSTDTQQPQIVDGGSVITEGTTPKAALDFDGVDDLLDIGQSIDLYSLASEWSIFMDTKIQDYSLQSFQNAITNDSSNSSPDVPMRIMFRDDNNLYFTVNGTTTTETLASATQRSLIGCIKRSSDVVISINGSSTTGTKGSIDFTSGLENTVIGNSPNGTSRPAKLKTAELIIYDSDQSTNRTDIESNINKHFKIYE